jgi:predicted RNase H-like HicB family nuclease
MVDVKPWSVNLEHGERWRYAHVVELPGCFTRGETREEVLGALPDAIADHIAFLEARGRPVDATTLDFGVVEEIHGIPELGEAGGAVALFSSDGEPVGEVEFSHFLDLMRWNRGELLGIVEPLSENERNARPLPDKWTIEETLRHVANAEEWYVSRLGAEVQEEYEGFIRGINPEERWGSILERLEATRRGGVHSLEYAFGRGVEGVFTRAAYTQHPEERWAFRKVLRRFVEHEREHIGTIKRVADALVRRG